MAGTIDFSTGNWVDTNADEVPDVAAASVYVNLSINAYHAYAQPHAQGANTIGETGDVTTVIGTSNADNLTGGLDSDTLNGGGGDDLLYSFNGNDVLNGGEGNDTLTGAAGTGDGHDVLNGGGGNDTIYGAFGSDVINGGSGDDTISDTRHDDVSKTSIDAGDGDDAVDLANGANGGFLKGGAGTDVLSGTGDISHLAISGVEILLGNQLIATCAQLEAFDHIGDSSGSPFSQTWSFRLADGGVLDLSHSLAPADALNLTASDFGNDLRGTLNDDYLFGGKGSDTLSGGSGSDHMEGADGNDILIGGGGQDQMWGGAGNDSYYVDGQDVVMQDDRGQDRVFASASFEIQSDCIRTLTLTGSAATDGTGNQLANLIIGNGAANTLAGLDGADKLRGGAGGDVLYGGNGRDILTGGKGRDDFMFYQSLSPSSRDKITDFNHRDDSIGLENAIMSKLGDGGHALNRDFFHVGATAADANDYVIYNSRNGHLSYDANGNEHGDMFLLAVLSHGPALQANDFHVV